MAIKFLSTVAVDTNVLYVDAATNRVGIGVTNPITDLHVNGHTLLTNNKELRWLDSTGTQKPILKLTAGNLLSLTAPDRIRATTDGTARVDIFSGHNTKYVMSSVHSFTDNNSDVALRISSSGKVGIKETNPTQELHVAGNLRVTGAYYDSNNSAGSSGQVLSSTASGTDWITPTSGTIGGSGTVNYIPKFTTTTAIGDSVAFEDSVGIDVDGRIIADIVSPRNMTEFSDIKHFEIPMYRGESVGLVDSNIIVKGFSSMEYGFNLTATNQLRGGWRITARQSSSVTGGGILIDNYETSSSGIPGGRGLGFVDSGDNDRSYFELDTNDNIVIGNETPASLNTGNGGMIFKTGVNGDTRATITKAGKMGVGVIAPNAKLDVDGGVKVANDTDTPSSSKVGTLRYRFLPSSPKSQSKVDMCMQTGTSTYAWVNIVTNTWTN